MTQTGDYKCMLICIHNQAFMDATGPTVYGKAGFICTLLLRTMGSLHPESGGEESSDDLQHVVLKLTMAMPSFPVVVTAALKQNAQIQPPTVCSVGWDLLSDDLSSQMPSNLPGLPRTVG